MRLFGCAEKYTLRTAHSALWVEFTGSIHDLFHNVNLRKVLFQSLPSYPVFFPSSLLWNKERKKIFLRLVSCLGHSLGNLTRINLIEKFNCTNGKTQDFLFKIITFHCIAWIVSGLEIWVNCYCWGNSSILEGRFSKWF